MIANLKEIISQAHNDLPEAGIVVYDCNRYDVFYIPKSELETFKAKLSESDRSRFETAQTEYLHKNNVLVVTFHDNEIIHITLYDEKENFADVCPLEKS